MKTSEKLYENKNSLWSDQLIREIHIEGIRPELIEESQRTCKNVCDSLSQEREVVNLLRQMKETDIMSFSHLFFVSFYAVMISKNTTWCCDLDVHIIALGAMLHDIGMLKLSNNLCEKDPTLMTPSELTQFRQHPSLGIELLQPVCILDLPVINIVHQHHERINKTGFPYQLADGDIDPRTKIVSVADEFASLIRSRQLAPMAAFQLLMQNDEIMAGLDRSAVLTLQDCFHQ